MSIDWKNTGGDEHDWRYHRLDSGKGGCAREALMIVLGLAAFWFSVIWLVWLR